MRSWVIQLKPVFFLLGAKGNNEKMAQTLHFMFRHLIQKENIPLKLPVLEKWIKLLRYVPLSWIRRLHTEQTPTPACFFSAQEASNNRSRETSGLLSIFVHLFCDSSICLLLPSVSAVIIGSKIRSLTHRWRNCRSDAERARERACAQSADSIWRIFWSV